MSYIEESLSDGEKIENIFSLHWFAKIPMFLWLMLGLVALVVAFFASAPSSPWLFLGAATLGATWLIALYEYFRLRSIEQGVTNKRVILKTGIVGRKSEEMKLSSIETVEIQQSILGRMCGYGTVKVTGKGISDVIFKNIDNPMTVKRQIESISNPIG